MYKYILIFGYLLLILSCERSVKPTDGFSKGESQVETAKKVEILYSDSAVVRIKITSDLLLSHLDKENPFDEFPQGAKLEFFDEQKQPSSVLTSKYAVRYAQKNVVILRDSCVWQSMSNREKLESYELIWDENLKKVYSGKLVIITTPSEKIWGYGFETNSDFTRWKINKPQGRISINN